MAVNPRLLLIDDDENKRFLIALHLKRRFPEASIAEYGSGEAAINHMEQFPVDAIVTDHSMSPVDGIQLIRWVRSRSETLPILMVTGHPSIEEQALSAGATEVIGSFRFTEVGEVLAKLLGDAGDQG